MTYRSEYIAAVLGAVICSGIAAYGVCSVDIWQPDIVPVAAVAFGAGTIPLFWRIAVLCERLSELVEAGCKLEATTAEMLQQVVPDIADRHMGSSLDCFLEEEGILDEVKAVAVKRVKSAPSRPKPTVKKKAAPRKASAKSKGSQ